MQENPFVAEDAATVARMGLVTILLIAVSVLFAIYSGLGQNRERLLPFFISMFPTANVYGVLPEVRHGEFWRLLTPMFVHFGLPHLVFNLLALKDFGTAIEHRQKPGFYLLLVVVLSLCANVGQYIASGPFFGGMSGVVYGLFGYIWIRSVYDPNSGYRMPRQTVAIMLGWFALCVLEIVGDVANTAHAAGLVVGALWGFVSARTSPTLPPVNQKPANLA